MKLPKPAPAEVPSAVEQAERLISQRADELARIETDLAAAEASLSELVESDDDAAYETASLNIDRLRRAEARAQRRLDAAHEGLAQAEGQDDNNRRLTLYQAGETACREAQTLINGEYKIHAAALARVLGRLDELYGVVKAANDNMPNGKNPHDHTIDVDAFRHEADTPASTHTEVETYFVDDAQQPRSGFDVRKFNAATTLVAKTREKVVHVRGWKGTKMSPLTWGVKLPAVTYDGPAFWPVRAN